MSLFTPEDAESLGRVWQMIHQQRLKPGQTAKLGNGQTVKRLVIEISEPKPAPAPNIVTSLATALLGYA